MWGEDKQPVREAVTLKYLMNMSRGMWVRFLLSYVRSISPDLSRLGKETFFEACVIRNSHVKESKGDKQRLFILRKAQHLTNPVRLAVQTVLLLLKVCHTIFKSTKIVRVYSVSLINLTLKINSRSRNYLELLADSFCTRSDSFCTRIHQAFQLSLDWL